MEYSLRQIFSSYTFNREFVLILILMEYSLRPCERWRRRYLQSVLILILMEYSLRLTFASQLPAMKIGLNPYSNGI